MKTKNTILALLLSVLLSLIGIADASASERVTKSVVLEGTIIPIAPETRDELDPLWLEEEGVPLPESVYGVQLDENGYYQLASQDGELFYPPRSVLGKAWKVTKCVAIIADNAAPAAAVIKKLGTVRKVAEALVASDSKAAAMAKIGAAGAALWDIEAIVTTCGMGWSDA